MSSTVKEITKFNKILAAFLMMTALVLLLQVNAKAQSLYSGVAVSDPATTGNSIANANTSRCLAVAPDGTIYAVYHGSNGIRVAKSINRGASFSPSVQVRSGNYEAEVAVSSTGTVYVTWVEGSNAMISRSTNGGTSFSAPITAGTASTSVHMAVDGNYVYLIERSGNRFYSSSDGGTTFTQKLFNESYVFCDVHVNSLTGEVVVQKDNPQIIYYISQNHGQTFGAKVTPSASVNYSVGAISAGPMGKYLFVAGYSTMSTRINLANGSAQTLSFGSSLTAQGRSLSVDGFGNVVTGFVNSGNVNFAVSQDLGNTFGAAKTISAANMANAAINSTNGDVMFLYESGGKVYLSVYADELKGYSLEVSTTNLNFGSLEVGSESVPKTVTVINKGLSPITVSSINITGVDYNVNHNLGSTLEAGQSYTITVNFAPKKAGACAGLISILTNVSTEPRTIQLSGTGMDTTPPSTTVQLTGVKGQNDVYGSAVTATFTAEDAFFGNSGILRTEYSLDQGQTWIQENGDLTLTADGSYELWYRSIDVQNNVEAVKKVSFTIDQTPPTAELTYSSTLTTNADVTVKMTPNKPVIITNNNGSDTYTFTENGTFTFEFVDFAGKTGTATATVANIDKEAPTICYTVSPAANSNGWQSQNVTVHFEAADALSGIDYVTPDITLTEECGNKVVIGKAFDKAGNEVEIQAVINLDKTAPILTGAATTAPNANGWYNTDVTVAYTATDALSGIAEVSPDAMISSEGGDQSVTGTAADKAGNSVQTTVGGINIDKTAPVITIGIEDGAVFKLNQKVNLNWSALDTLSGIDKITSLYTSGQAIDTSIAGKKTITITAVDKAGNIAIKTITYYIQYSFIGVLSPLVDGQNNQIKIGRTVPVKFQLKDYNGNYISTASAQLYLVKPDGSVINAVSSGNSNSGNAFRYDTSENQYIFNWSTKNLASGIWKLKIVVDDGTVYYLVATLN